MSSLILPLALFLFMIPLVVSIMRANELFCLRVEGRHVRILRGRLPQRLLNDIVDVLRAEAVGRGTVRVLVEDQRARVYVEGDVTREQGQRIKNIVSMWPIPKIRNAPRPR